MNNGRTVQIPEMYTRRKLNALYREIPLKDNVFRLLRKYVNAAANLYGIVPVRVLFDIIEKHAPGKITKAEFLSFMEIARHEREDYYILGADELYEDSRKTSLMDREIIDASLLYTNSEQYLHMKELQKSKPFYIPDKAEFLCYNDSAFCDASEETAVLQSFVAGQLHSDTLERTDPLRKKMDDDVQYRPQETDADGNHLRQRPYSGYVSCVVFSCAANMAYAEQPGVHFR